MNIYLTDIALPYGLMITEHENPENNHMKVDIYAPVITDDRYRPSFYLMKNDSETNELYTRFCGTFEHIRNEYAELYQLHANIRWMRGDKPIIHRGMIDKKARPHTKSAFLKCLAKGYPIEVDLLELSDGTIIVGREDEIETNYGIARVSDMDYRELNRKLRAANIEEQLKPMRLDDFLDLIHGKIQVILEIKCAVYDQKDLRVHRIAENVVTELRRYIRHYGQNSIDQNIAVHSANPYILRVIRDKNCMIPIGQISLNFEKRPHSVAPEVLDVHKNRKYFEVVVPDFISYNIDDLPDTYIQSACKQYGIPLIAWTVRSQDDEEYADRCCVIIL